MDDAPGTASEPGRSPDLPPDPPSSDPTRSGVPAPPDGQATPQPGQGLQMEPCYRHPDQLTGVHCTRCGKPICVECMRPAAVGYQCPDCMAAERGSGYKYQRGVQSTTGMTPVTRALIVITAAVFVVELAIGASQLVGFDGNPYKLIRMGAGYPPLTAGVAHIVNGQPVPGLAVPQLWRLVTPIFLHLGLIHILMNMYALAILGPPIERAYGPRTFLALYLVTGIMGNVASFFFGPIQVGVGASTAVFGLLGVWLAYNYRRRSSPFHQANLRAVLITLGINLVLNLSLAGFVDWRGHVGGFVAGALLGYAAEGVGSREGVSAGASKVLGFVVVLGVGAVLVFVRIHQLQTLFGV